MDVIWLELKSRWSKYTSSIRIIHRGENNKYKQRDAVMREIAITIARTTFETSAIYVTIENVINNITQKHRSHRFSWIEFMLFYHNGARKAKGVRPGFGFFEAILMVVLKNAGRIGRLPAPAEIAGENSYGVMC